ncbi:hypothetical protein [Roseateles sp. L2-2]|uniref:hypothetical protein n=1 Tax=Roseateles sp. L2-2 TaxID=3422597 RepID=UPI003D35BFA9
MTKKVRPNAHIWMHAEQFYNAAELMWQGDVVRLSLPMVVNYSLAAELAIKSAEGVTTLGDAANMIVDGQVVASVIGAATLGSAVHGHGLAAVFSKLQQAAQTDIAQKFKTATGEELAPLLTMCADYFVNARYAYEMKAGLYNIGAVRTLADGLLKAVMAHGLNKPN